ncbi:MAG TPA: hypothetical protein VMS00_06075 [Acidimicrobiales bacterium]|nr:hypothetical protein [Acidimicrobiales bacterium]
MFFRVGASVMVSTTAITCAPALHADASSGRAPTATNPITGKPLDLPPAMYLANPIDTGRPINPSQAKEVFETFWKEWQSALLENNTAALTQLMVPGPLLLGQIYHCVWPGGGCTLFTKPQPINDVLVAVPSIQNSYPIDFAVEVQTTDYAGGTGKPVLWPFVELLVLSKAHPASSWALTFEDAYGAEGHVPPLVPIASVNGYNAPFSGSTVPVGSFLPLLAQYYQSWKDTGKPPAASIFAENGDAYRWGEYFAESPEGNVYRETRQDYDFTVDQVAGKWIFTTADAQPIVCGTLLDTSTNTPVVKGEELIQNQTRTNWGMQLPPGLYKQVITKTIHPTCITIFPGNRLDNYGEDPTYDVAITGDFVAPLPVSVPVTTTAAA